MFVLRSTPAVLMARLTSRKTVNRYGSKPALCVRIAAWKLVCVCQPCKNVSSSYPCLPCTSYLTSIQFLNCSDFDMVTRVMVADSGLWPHQGCTAPSEEGSGFGKGWGRREVAPSLVSIASPMLCPRPCHVLVICTEARDAAIGHILLLWVLVSGCIDDARAIIQQPAHACTYQSFGVRVVRSLLSKHSSHYCVSVTFSNISDPSANDASVGIFLSVGVTSCLNLVVHHFACICPYTVDHR